MSFRVPAAPAAPAALLALGALLVLAGCSGGTSIADVPLEGLQRAGGGVPIPNATAGDAVRRGVAQPAAEGTPMTQAQAETLARRRLSAAESLWERATATEAQNPGGAAELYASIFDNYPEYERAAEAKFREGRARVRVGDCDDAAAALKEYMRIAPVNPHLAEVEELLYEAGSCGLLQNRGLMAVFRSDDASLNALKFVAANFPTGEYADDSLMKLGDYFRYDEDYETAALHYKELLLRYPDSEWSFKARMALAETYLARDQGQPYDAGFIDVDPREMMPAEQAKMVAPVTSALELALEQYDAFLERMEADPARAAEYSSEVVTARERRGQVRERIAGKDLFRGDWYRSRGCPEGALQYYRSAATWTGTRAARDAQTRLAAMEGRRAPGATTPTSTRAAPRVVTSTPSSVAPPSVTVPRRPTAPRPRSPGPGASPVPPPARPGVPPPPPPPPLAPGMR